jgi:alpha-tubulin suppressor-like RCC1 family protein
MRPTTITGAAAGPLTTFLIDNNGDLWRSGYSTWRMNCTSWERDCGITDVTAVTDGDGHTLAITTDGTLWGIGINNNSPLGLPERDNYTAWEQLTPGNIVKADAYRAHSIALDGDGHLWAAGENYANQAGLDSPHTRLFIDTWTRVGPDHVTAVATGEMITAAVTVDGDVWWCGGGTHAPWTRIDLTSPTLLHPADSSAIPQSTTAVDVAVSACGQFRIVTDDGNVIAFGAASHRSYPDGRIISTAQLDAAHIHHGTDPLFGHTYVITRDQRLLVSDGGWRERRSLGTECAPGWYDTGLENVASVAEGRAHAVVVHTDGTLRGVGDTDIGELGHVGQPILTPVQFPTDPDHWRLFCDLRAGGADATDAADVAARLC